MKMPYRGYTINLTRSESLGGWDCWYFHIIRERDGYYLEDDFTTGSDTQKDMLNMLKRRVDRDILENGR